MNSGVVSIKARASSGPQLTLERESCVESKALRTGILGCHGIVAPARREPPVDRWRATRSFLRSFLRASLVCRSSRLATDNCQRLRRNGRLESSFYPSELGARPVRAKRTRNEIAERVNKKTRANPDRSFARAKSSLPGADFWRAGESTFPCRLSRTFKVVKHST